MKKYFLFSLIILSTFLTLPVNAEVPINSGFISGQIWYSKSTLVEGETVNIHTAVWNGEKDLLSAKVEFYDKNVILGSRDVVLASLELKDVYISWKITSGDHTISAKIISSTVTILGKNEKVVLDRIATSNDKQFVPVIVRNDLGVPVSREIVLQDQINKTNAEIKTIVPEKVRVPILNGFVTVDNFRDKTFTQVTAVKDETQEKINLINGDVKKVPEILIGKSSIENATEKPIAYIKLFLFSILVFIFGNKIVFYGFSIIIIFFIIRSIYRKIRSR